MAPGRPTRLAVVGLGRMGLPIARHLARIGHDVTVYDSDPGRMRLADASGLRLGASAAAIADDAAVLVAILPGAAEFEDLMLGPSGIVDRLAAGSCWLDLTSNDPRVARRVDAASSARGVLAVGAPMAGGIEAAETASLEFYVGGAPAARDLVAPVLTGLARPDGVRLAGDDIGSGYSAKLLVNLLWFGQVAAVSEALLLGRRLGLAPAELRRLIAGSAADSSFARRHLDGLLAGDYAETFGLRECVAELDIVTELARETGSPFEVSSLIARLHHDALDRFGPVDGEMLVARLLEEQAGDRLRDSGTPGSS
ncbi:NAD(P)-dependent oxidoreductase [Microbacterium sp.]|uniref:NAD(P)-dependent oxidoreductase n=1 Tax=Microbacterium sp. TaxID=51671 RepID=UPI002E37D705|nr:NAD(P)-binding domain-containing protein [Microbacterium sp.]HEX5729439.1 NAD(P)-binding domain-containing protein [Microbacterium sp.]